MRTSRVPLWVAKTRPMSSSRSQVSSYECISELFNCYICTEKLREAAMCPHCSQIGCIACVKRWTDTKKECPHCREEITAEQLIRVPIFDELIEQLTDQQPLESPGKDLEFKMCSEHSLSIEVYCAKCNTFICHECALWGKHRGHAVEKADDYYKKQRTVVEEKLNNLKDFLKIVLSHVEQTEKKMEDLRRSYAKSAKDSQRVVTDMMHEFEKKTKSNMKMLEDVKHKLEAQGKEIAAVSLELSAKMRSRSFSSILTQTGELRRDIELKLEKIGTTIASFDSIPSVEPLMNRIVPKYEYAILTIHPFQAKQNKGEEMFSNSLNIDGMTWRLKVYPNGHKEDIGKYLSVFIELTSGFERKANYQYSITMLFNASEKYPHKDFHKEYESDFSDGESWGYRKFYDLSKLKADGFLKNDTIVLKFGVRAPTYCQKCGDLSQYVQRLEQMQKTQAHKIAELQQRVESHMGHHQGATPQTSPGHSGSRRTLVSQHHSHSKSHATVSHQHSYSDDSSRDPPPPHTDSDGLKRSHHISTQQLRSPSHPSSRRTDPRHSIQANTLHPPLPVQRRRSSVDHVGISHGATAWQHTSMASGFRGVDDIVLGPPSDQAPPTPPKLPASTQQPAIALHDTDSFNSQPSDLEDIKLLIDDNGASESSLQTVIGTDPCPPVGRNVPHGGSSQPSYEEEDDHSHVYEANHLSSQPTSHDFEPSGLYEREGAGRRELNLSQATAPTTSSRRLQKSLTDLSTLTDTSNLQNSSHLSQSVLEMSEGRRHHKGQTSGSTPRATPTMQQSTQGDRRGGRRDSSPNVNGPLGLASTVSAVLWNGQTRKESVPQGHKESVPLGHSGRSSSSSSINMEIL